MTTTGRQGSIARVLALIGDTTGCTLWRIWQPFAELQRRQYPAEWAHNQDPLTDRVVLSRPFDAVILPRLTWPAEYRWQADNWFRALHNVGMAVIYEVDDDMFSEDYERFLVNVRDFTPERARENRESVTHTVKLADGVTVSSRRLATIVRQITDKPVEVVENSIDWDWFRAVQAHAPRAIPGLTIGWAGGARDDADVEAMAIAWGRIARDYPGVTFVIQGHQPAVIFRYVPKERVQSIEWLPLESYPLGIAQMDIGCAPLADTPFNRAKTYIKALEYGASGAAVVASPTVYGQVIRHGENGFIADTPGEWYAALSALIDDADERRRLATTLAVDVKRKHTLQGNAIRWPAAWISIVDEFKRRASLRRLWVPGAGGARLHA